MVCLQLPYACAN
ncbi:hypothetical protein EC80586_5026, partial [Escherichia coli 8.0586]